MSVQQIKRREFIAALGGAVAWPAVARAQQPERMRRVGVLMAVGKNDPLAQPWIKVLEDGLGKLGWEVGGNLRIEYRWTGGNVERIGTSAAELVSFSPDVLLAGNTTTATALQRETRSIPIVFVLVGDPIGSGFVESLARPGGNLTGFISFDPPIAGKQLELLKEIAPSVHRVAFVFNPVTAPYMVHWLQVAQASAASLGTEIVEAHVHNIAEIESAISTQARQPSSGLFVGHDITTVVNRELIVALAAQYRMPAVYPYRFFVTSGGLASYGSDITDHYRLAVGYIDHILKGEKPADLPVQAPSRFELVINLKAAKALGLEIPPMLLARADEVIE
jgi:putative ABC transport system substrate-binding protein